MLKIFKNKKENKIDIFIKIASLLIHAAKIDEKYTDIEKKIIKKAIIKLGAEENDLSEIFSKGEEIESDSNQLLEFTKEIKNLNQTEKREIIESLWNIIYSDSNSDMYESNLMRRLSGLLYIDDKVVGEIKQKVKSNFIK